MTFNIRKIHFTGVGIFTLVTIIACLIMSDAFAAHKKTVRPRKKTVDQRVYLQHADELMYDAYGSHPDAQFVKGNVAFLHKGMHLTCDSAYFYEESNSFEAFGNVHMWQGDTLSLTSVDGYYDGNSEMAHAWKNVVMKHRDETLYCDTLDYDRMYGIADAYGSHRIKLTNKTDVLVADWGRHFTEDDHSEFFYDVVLTNDKGLRIETDTLYHYNKTSMAHATGPSVITQKNNKVNSTDCWYNTKTEKSELYGRSTVYNGEKEITADSLYNDDKTGISEGFGNAIYKDPENKNMLLGEYCRYNNETGYGMATIKALAIDYSQKDTLWMHGDTIKIKTYYIDTDSVQREVHCYNHVRAFRNDVQAVCDSLVFHSKDSCMTMYKDPVVWTQGSQLLGEEIKYDQFGWFFQRFCEVYNRPDLINLHQISTDDVLLFSQYAGYDLRFKKPVPIPSPI